MTNVLYFVETTSPRVRGAWFLEVDRDDNSREHAVAAVRAGGVVKVLEINEDEGTCRNVTEDILEEASVESDPTFDRPNAADALAAKWDRAADHRKHSDAM